MAESDLGERLSNPRARRWKAGLETDLADFCRKEGIPFVPDWPRKGAGILNALGAVLEEAYYNHNVRTIKDLTALTKLEFLEYGGFYGERKKAEECWRVANNILKRHSFRMYVKGRTYDN